MSDKPKNTHRRATEAELKEHEKNKPAILAAIRKVHGATCRKVQRMQEKPMYVDKRGNS